MCGISFLSSGPSPEFALAFGKMMQAIRHRGPDGIGQYSFSCQSNTVHIGSHRLAVRDLNARADQPFRSSQNKHFLSLNGEIYNFRPLRAALKSNQASFVTEGDTEVVFEMLRHKGFASIHELQGMYALVFVDRERDELLLARDPSGIKNLYYHQNGSLLLASSEIKGILASGLVSKKLNTTQVPQYFLYKAAAEPATLFQDIYCLKPGEIRRYRLSTSQLISVHQVRRPLLPEGEMPNQADIVIHTHDLIAQALTLHCEADVPAGLLLSGGVDSSLLLAISHHRGLQLPAYSVVCEGAAGLDADYARATAKKFGVDHEELYVNSSLLQRFPEYINQLDQPIADGGVLLNFALAGRVANNHKTVLSGAGADELFGGYRRHTAFRRYLHWRWAVRALPPSLPGKLATIFHSYYLRKGLQSLQADADTCFRHMNSQQGFLNIFNPMASKETPRDWLTWALDHDLSQYLVKDVLAMTDATFMHSGVEVRLPYLHHPLQAYVRSLPGQVRMQHGSKWVLKNMLRQYDLDAIATRPKEGFGMPLAQWLGDKEHHHLFDVLARKECFVHDFLPHNMLKDWIKEVKAGKARHVQELWSVLLFEHWARQMF